LPSVTGESERSRRKGDGGDATQAILGRQGDHGRHDNERARTGAREIGAIDGTDPCRLGGKTETDGAPGSKERQRQ